MPTARIPIDAAHRAASSDAHPIGAIVGLDAALADKAPLSHTTQVHGVHRIVSPNSTSVGLGYLALASTTGAQNTAVGNTALYGNTSGYQNTSIGYYSLRYNSTGNSNTAIGDSALRDNTTGASNTAVGVKAGTTLADGSTANETPTGGVYIGRDVRASVASADNETVIGYMAIGGGSNTMRFGNTSVTNWLPGATNKVYIGNATTALKGVYLSDGTDEWLLTVNTSGALVTTKQE